MSGRKRWTHLEQMVGEGTVAGRAHNSGPVSRQLLASANKIARGHRPLPDQDKEGAINS